MFILCLTFRPGIDTEEKNIKVRLVESGNKNKELSYIYEKGYECIKRLNSDIKILSSYVPTIKHVYNPLPAKDKMSCSDEKHTKKIIESLFKDTDSFTDAEYWTNSFKNTICMLRDKNARSQILNVSKHVVLSPYNIIEMFKALVVMYKQVYYITRYTGDDRGMYFRNWSFKGINNQFSDLYRCIESLPDDKKSTIKVSDDMYEIILDTYLYNEFVKAYIDICTILEPLLETWWANDRLDKFVDLLLDKSSTDYDVLKCFGYVCAETDNSPSYEKQSDTKSDCGDLHHKKLERVTIEENISSSHHEYYDKSKEPNSAGTVTVSCSSHSTKHNKTKPKNTSTSHSQKKKKRCKHKKLLSAGSFCILAIVSYILIFMIIKRSKGK